MSGISQFQTVFRISKQDGSNGSKPSSTVKRIRPPVSCLACRARKLKCDRQVPCTSCSKSNDGRSCNYGAQGPNKRDDNRKTTEAQARLQKLEEMVTNLISEGKAVRKDSVEEIALRPTNGHSSYVTPPLEGDEPAGIGSGHLDIKGAESDYVGSTNWITILNDIRDVRDVLDLEKVQEDSLEHVFNPQDVLLDTTRSLTLVDVFEALPPKTEADNLVSLYFNTCDISVPIIHAGKFSREYERFWSNPNSVSFLWISILFSILSVGSTIKQRRHENSELSNASVMASLFWMKAGQALVTGQYQRAVPYSVESIFLYALCRVLAKEDPDKDAWMLIGVSVRLAMKMGYHRDAKYLQSVSPFEGEMRRRTFYIISIFDLLISFQAGMPAIIHEDEVDAEDPSNLFDSDFDETSETLPPSRPYTDATPMLYHRYKGRLGRVFRRVARHALSKKNDSHDEVMTLDRELRAINSEVPPSLKMRPIRSSVTDQPHIILQRLYVELMYLKSLCVLHRSYLTRDMSDHTFDESRKTCVESALKMLDYQAELHVSGHPMGIFGRTSWTPSSLMQQEFLLAATIICLDLHNSPVDHPDRDRKLRALRLSYSAWVSRKSHSTEAKRATKIIAMMLSKVSGGKEDVFILSFNETSPQVSDISNISGQDYSTNSSLKSQPLTSDLSEDIPEGFNIDLSALNSNNVDQSNLNSIFDQYDNLDWGRIDQYILNQNESSNNYSMETMSPDGIPFP